jgi:molybdopterin-guanine dinucleotide biosynthesis protein A
MGTSKALLDFGGETMLQRVVRLLGTVLAPTVVVAAPDQILPELPSSIIVTRDEQPGRGPLEGLRAGLDALPPDVELAYVTSCDVPLLVPAFAGRLVELAAEFDIAVVEIDGFPQPLSAVYRRRSVLPRAEALLAEDRRRLAFLFDAVRTRRVSPSEVSDVDPMLLTLRNLNNLEDYRQARVIAGLDAAPAESNDLGFEQRATVRLGREAASLTASEPALSELSESKGNEQRQRNQNE